MDSAVNWLTENSDMLLHYAVQAIVAIVILLVGIRIAKMAEKLTIQAGQSPREPASFQPPSKTNLANVNERYEGCPLTVRCVQRQ